MDLSNLRQHDLLELIKSYDMYIQDANNKDLFSMGWRPVCIEEYYHNDFQEEAKRDYITIGDKLVVTDPCYCLDALYQVTIENMEPGRYECFLDTINANLGIYNSCIMLFHENYDPSRYYPGELESNLIAVDSGQAGFFDYNYYEEHRGTEEIENNEPSGIFYDKCCDITIYHKDRAGIFDDKCFVSSSGFGDGFYRLYSSKNKFGKVIALRLEFIKASDY